MYELLINKAKKGDKESFSRAVLEVKDDAYKIAFCYLRNEADSMDAVCDAVEKSMVNLKKLKQPRFFKTWFIRIVINEAKMQLRQRDRVTRMVDNLCPDPGEYSNREDKIDLEKLLGELAPLERLIIYMKYYMGYTFDEISRSVGLPAGTVKTKTYGTLKQLKARLEGKEG